jgi:uncharacterized membrane protein YedE/YeeE
MKRLAVAFVAGVIFAVGLGISGMTDPARVLGFLDVAGHWDPSLAFVMAGAIGVHLGPAQWALRARRPLWSDAFVLPGRTAIDGRLVAGSILFGIGWGIAGYCPGPAIVNLVAPSRHLLAFVAAMVVGTGLYRATEGHATDRAWPPSPLVPRPPSRS